MNTLTAKRKLLFVINKGSGNNAVDHEALITQFFNGRDDVQVVKRLLRQPINCDELQEGILREKPDKVIAVGGDGTLKLLAEILLGTNIPIGILPAGSANGMA